jgi:thiamine pyrophosphokinase
MKKIYLPVISFEDGENMGKKCIIIAASPDFVWRPEPDAGLIIACDGGLLHAEQAGIKADVIMGDFDSYPNFIEPDGSCRYQDGKGCIIRSPAEKDDTDTMLAVKFGLAKGYTDFLLLGAMGGRPDHELANLCTAGFIASHGGTCTIRSAQGEIRTLSAGMNFGKNDQTADTGSTKSEQHIIEIPFCANYVLSVFSFTDRALGVTLSGVRYPLHDAILENTFPLGISNEILPPESSGGPAGSCGNAVISLRKGILLIYHTRR